MQKGEQGLFLPSTSSRRARAFPPDVGLTWPLAVSEQLKKFDLYTLLFTFVL
jgi:hypothetical protein